MKQDMVVYLGFGKHRKHRACQSHSMLWVYIVKFTRTISQPLS